MHSRTHTFTSMLNYRAEELEKILRRSQVRVAEYSRAVVHLVETRSQVRWLSRDVSLLEKKASQLEDQIERLSNDTEGIYSRLFGGAKDE